MTRLLIPLLAAALLFAGCGEKAETTTAGSGKTEPFTVMLDYFPNADHAGIYAAQASGEYERAGYDHVYLHQVGPDQEGFLRFAERELLPRYS